MAIWNHKTNEPVRHCSSGVNISEISLDIGNITKAYIKHFNEVLALLSDKADTNDIRFDHNEMIVFSHIIINGLFKGDSPEETVETIRNHPLAKS